MRSDTAFFSAADISRRFLAGLASDLLSAAAAFGGEEERRDVEVAIQNKAVVYGLLFRAVADTLRTIAADPRHLGAEIGFFAVLHTWGQTLVHHPHLHCVIPVRGAGERRPQLGCLPPRVLPAGPGPVTLLPSCPPRGAAGRLRVRRAALRRPAAGPQRPPAIRRASPPSPRDRVGGLREATLRRPRTGPRLPRPLHPPDRHRQPAPVQSRRRLRALPLRRLPPGRRIPPEDYDPDGRTEFIRRMLLHVLPPGFHRIRYYGLPRQSLPAAEADRVSAVAVRAAATTGRAGRPRRHRLSGAEHLGDGRRAEPGRPRGRRPPRGFPRAEHLGDGRWAEPGRRAPGRWTVGRAGTPSRDAEHLGVGGRCSQYRPPTRC